MAPPPGTARPARVVSEVSNLTEYYEVRGQESIVPAEGAAAAAALLLQADALDGQGAIDGLAHVVDGQGGDADGGEGLHLDAGAAVDADGGLDVQFAVAGEGEVEGGGGDRQGVAQGDQVAGALGGQDAGEAGHLQDVALGEGAVADEGRRGRGHADQAAGAGLAQRLRLAAGVHHAAGAVLVEVGQLAHDVPTILAASRSSAIAGAAGTVS